MANKTIGQLTEATSVQTTDLFLLEQTGTAKKLTGQTLINDLAAALDGHGGIVSSTYTAPVAPSLVGTMTFTMADETVFTVPVENGEDGFTPTISVSDITGGHRLTITGRDETNTVDILNGTNGTNGTDGTDGVTFLPSVSEDGVISWTNDGGRTNPTPVNVHGAQGNPAYVWIRWASQQPTSDADIGVIPDAWMGVYGGDASTAPTAYTAYQWYEVKGEQGEHGDPITAVTRTSGDGSPGTDDTYTVYVNSTAVGTFIVHNGSDGIGTVNSVNGIGVSSGTNNVVLTAADVGAAAVPLHLQATATSLPLTISNSAITATMRVIECTFGTPSAISSDVTWTTSSGSIVLSGTMSGSTTVDLVLIETT